MRILICGDSFAADWRVAYPDSQGWPTLLERDFDVTNRAQAGACEYRIWQQIKAADQTRFDHVIVSHTNPYRLYVREHPVHRESLLHQNCDLLYSDAVDHGLDTVREYFEKYFDLDYARDIQCLVMNEIQRTMRLPVTHIAHFDVSAPPGFPLLDFSSSWQSHRGLINHYDQTGNHEVYKHLLDVLK